MIPPLGKLGSQYLIEGSLAIYITTDIESNRRNRVTLINCTGGYAALLNLKSLFIFQPI